MNYDLMKTRLNNVVGERLLDFLAVLTVFSLVHVSLIFYLIIVLLLELIVFPYRLQVLFTSMGL